MKEKLIILIGIFFLFIGWKKESKPNLLQYINRVNKLEILTVDDKCGEWGGNERMLTIYRDDLKGQLLGDYIEKVKNCKDKKEAQITKSIKRIKLTQQETELILESVNELCEKKLNREDYPSHSGIFNRIMLSDSSIVIKDFPSVELTSLNKLVTELKKK
ncbi:hypothetical protein [Flavobacterium aquicola]|uniref:Uncharacterized protein n=1 Tax=Flavobacterium aquicola TaxID=1682742 RepID=A0A3E0EL67_9FLAO|nr:hypothetical protein [Flavobacterium aquicola]REG99002.1 hypothetical protein C8P67_105167 [Flavobacterium aquicola]